MARRFGVLLAGCGLYDGTEVQEAVLTLLALDRAGMRAEPIAPDRPQHDVVDHASTAVTETDGRNVLSESCRIARGRVTPLAQASPDLLDGLFLPGGYGAAKNWMTGFAEPGRRREPLPEIRGLVEHFLESGKPLGVVSLGETLLAAVLGRELREDPFSVPAAEIVPDPDRNIVYTPGFLASDSISEVAAGIEKMVAAVISRTVAPGR